LILELALDEPFGMVECCFGFAGHAGLLQQSHFFVYDKPPISIKISPRANEYDSYDRDKGLAKSFLYSEKRDAIARRKRHEGCV
jgi:hypothetical protein